MSIDLLLQQAAAGATAVDTGDDDFANVVLLLDGDGTSGDNNNTFTDSSTNGFTVTESGSVVQGSFSPYGDNWSNYFNGTDYIYGTVNALGTGDFTLECWVNFSSLGANRTIMSFGQFSPALYYRHASTELAVYHIANGGAFYLSGFTPEIGEWYHVAFTRSGTTSRMFVNGTQQGSDTTYSTNITDTTLRIGYDGVDYTDAYISNVRVVKGTALYTSNFTAPTSPLSAVTNTELLTCQSNRFVDNGSNSITVSVNSTPKVTPFSPFKNDDARTLTTDGGSGYFDDSSNSYLQIADNSVFDATTSLCIEAWFYMTSSPGSGPDAHAVVSKWVSTTPGQRTIFIDIENTGLRVYADLQGASNPVLITTDGGAISQHEWHHVAVTWDGSTYRAFLDGALEGSTSSSSAPIASSQVVRVGYNTNTHYFGGYITDVRWITDGGAIYTSGFTPPTSPLTAITNTELLLNFQDAGIYDRSGINNLDTVGDARLGFAPIYGTGSLEFDGTGDYLTAKVTPLVDFGSGDWTVESWINLSTINKFNNIVNFGRDTVSGVSLDLNSSNQLRILAMIGGSWIIVATGATGLSANTWYHVAFVRNGSSFKIYLDGTEDGSGTNSGSITNPTSDASSAFQVGYWRILAGTDRYFSGYMDDLRITKGVARYTSNFTPPTEIDLALDTHAENVVFFLDGDGTPNGQNNTFTDSSTNGFTITESGSVVQGVFSPYGDNWSNSFDGNSDALTIADSADFDFGTGDFTMEAWVYPTDLTDTYNYPTIVSAHEGTDNTTWIFAVSSTNKLVAYGGGSGVQTSTSDVPLNEWSHVMITRSSGTIRFFINGTLDASTYTSTGNYNASASGIAIGKQPADGGGGGITRYWQGWISNVRLIKGTALHTSSFTPSTTPLTAVTNTVLLACQSNRFIDNSSSSHTLTPTGTASVTRFSPFESNKPYDITTYGGSGDFNGSEYLTVTTDSNLSFSNYAGDFTVEAWFYPTAVAQSSGSWLWFQGATGTSYSPFIIYQNPSTYNFTMYASSNGSSWNLASAATIGTAQANAWNHIAIVRDGTNIKCYMNGVLGSTTAVGTTALMTTTGNVVVGSALGNANTYLNGYVANLRAVKGSVVYSSAFTPPTSLVTAITNTELLLNFQDSAIPDLSGLNNIDTVGNAKVGASDPTKYGSNAMAFDGSGDYLQTIPTEELYFTDKDFTVEGWVYLNNLSSTQTFFYYGATNRSTSNASGIAFSVLYYSGYFRASSYYASTGGFAANNTLVTPSAGQWYHVAYYRIGSQFYLAVDGNVANVGSFTQPLLNGSAWVFRAGIESDSIGNPLNGYLDDVRITMGKARYGTSNFTPPDAALPKF